MPAAGTRKALEHRSEWYDYRASVDAIEDSLGLDVLNAPAPHYRVFWKRGCIRER